MSEKFWHLNASEKKFVLFLEVVALFHDLGKLSDKFLLSQARQASGKVKGDDLVIKKYSYNLIVNPESLCIETGMLSLPGNVIGMIKRFERNAMNDITLYDERKDLTDIFCGQKKKDCKDTIKRYSMADILFWQYARSEFVKYYQALNESGGRGNYHQSEVKPASLIRYLHGIAHFEKEGSGNPTSCYRLMCSSSPFGYEKRIPIGDELGNLTEKLNELPLNDIDKIYGEERIAWLNDVRSLISKGIADTRRPTNEVTLWDWGYIVSCMAKAAVNWICKNNWPGLLNLGDISYRTLRISINKLERYICADKISDLLGVKKELEDAFEKARILLEEKYAFGNCFYEDETGAYYLMGDIHDDNEFRCLKEKLQQQFPFDLQPHVARSDKTVTGNELSENKLISANLIAEPRKQSHNDPPVTQNNFYGFDQEWHPNNRPENAEICSVCGVRPIGYPEKDDIAKKREGFNNDEVQWATKEKAISRSICRLCLMRRGRRAKQWAKEHLGGTIWLDEVADENGKVALVVGKFGLEPWLDGSMLDTLMSDNKKSKKNPSPARLYRISKTAKTFWDEVQNDLTQKGSTDADNNYRLILIPPEEVREQVLQDSLGGYHAYELRTKEFNLSVLWDTKRSYFITTENLEALRKSLPQKLGIVNKNKLINTIKAKSFGVFQASEFGKQGSRVCSDQISFNVEPDSEFYTPVIPLLAEPSVFMALLPANKALDLVERVNTKYEEEMGKVRDRLPIGVGLVFATNRMPVRAILEAGRSMLGMIKEEYWEDWVIKEKINGVESCKIMFDNDVEWETRITATEDASVIDRWYSNVYASSRRENTFSEKKILHIASKEFEDKSKPWKIWVRPSFFDFEYLDASGRRCEIHYDANMRRQRKTRPFYLDDFNRIDDIWNLMKTLKKTQRHQILQTIETTRDLWYGEDDEGIALKDPVFRQFVADTLADAEWPKMKRWLQMSDEEHEWLVKAGVSGKLADIMELYMEILSDNKQ